MASIQQNLIGNLGRMVGINVDTNTIPLFQEDPIKRYTQAPDMAKPIVKTISMDDFLTESDTQGLDPVKQHELYVKLRNNGVNVEGYEEIHSKTLEDLAKVQPQIQKKQEIQKIKDEEKGLLSRVGEAWGKRSGEVAEGWSKLYQGTQNPLSTALQTIGNVAGGVGDVAVEGLISGYKSLPEGIQGSIGEQAKSVAGTSLGKKGLELLQKGGEGWTKFREKHPTIARDLEAIGNIGGLVPIGGAGKVGATVGTATAKGVGKVIKGADYAASNTFKNILSRNSGYARETIDEILNNVDEFISTEKGDLNVHTLKEKIMDGLDKASEELADINANYGDAIKMSTERMDINDEINGFIKMLNDRKVNIQKNGKLNFKGKTSISDVADQSSLQKVYDELLKFNQSANSAEDLLNLRKSLYNMTDWRNPLSDTVSSVVKSVGTKISEKVKSIPGFRELDDAYTQQIDLVKGLQKDLLTAGNEKNNIFSVIRNLTNRGNELRLQRIEKIVPGIGSKIRALKAVDDIQNINKVGIYTAALIGAGGLLTYSTGNPVILGLALLSIPGVTPSLLKNYAKTKQFIGGLGQAGLSRIRDVADKLSTELSDEAIIGKVKNIGGKLGETIVKRVDEGVPTQRRGAVGIGTPEEVLKNRELADGVGINKDMKDMMYKAWSDGKDNIHIGTVRQFIKDKSVLNSLDESVLDTDIWINNKHLDSMQKEGAISDIRGAFELPQGKAPHGTIYIRGNTSTEQILEEIMHAQRYAKGRNMKYPDGVNYDDISFEKSAKKGAEYLKNKLTSKDSFNKVGTTENALVEEAKKYKSADEFITKKLNGVNKGGDTDSELGKQYKIEIGDNEVSGWIKEDNNNIILNTIGVSGKGKGLGSKFLNTLKEYADIKNKNIIIPETGPNVQGFYKSFDWLKPDNKTKITFEGETYVPKGTFSYKPAHNKSFNKVGTTENALVEEAKKYKSARDMYNNLPPKEREIFDENGIYSLKHFEKFYEDNILSKKGEISVYRGQTEGGNKIAHNDTRFVGNIDGGVFFTPNKDSAMKYGENLIELKSNKGNTLSYKEIEKLQKMATTKVKEDIRNGKESSNIIEQMALGKPKAFAEYTKKPFIETGDMFGEPGELIFYKEFDNQ